MAEKKWLERDYGKYHRKHDDEVFEDGVMKKPSKNPKRRRFFLPEQEPHSTGKASKQDKNEAESSRHSLPKDKRIPKEEKKKMIVAVVRRKMKKSK
jgi:hypothetical protein